MSASRPKRPSHAINLMDSAFNDCSRKRQRLSEPLDCSSPDAEMPLEELVDTLTAFPHAHRKKRGTNTSDIWERIHQRIQSHPDEILPRNFEECLLISHHVIPNKVIEAFLRAGDFLRWEAFRFLTICPWLPVEKIECVLDIESEVSEPSSDADNSTGNIRRIMKLVKFCARAFEALRRPNENKLPRIDVLEAILNSPVGYRTVTERNSEDEIPIHFACMDERNVPYIRLLLENNPPPPPNEDPSSYRARGLLAEHNFGTTPLNYIAQRWSDGKAAEMFEGLIDNGILSTNEVSLTNVLNIALRENKWELSRNICRLAPECIMRIRSDGKLCTAATLVVFSISDGIQMSLVQFMVEQSLRVAKTEGQRKSCGILLERFDGKSLLNFLYCQQSSKTTNLCKGVMKYLVKGMKTFKKRENELHLMRIVEEAIAIKAWDIVRHFIETYPTLLSVKDNEKHLVLHHLCRSTQTDIDLIEKALEVGIRYGVGGKKGRGGLVAIDASNKTPLNSLAARANGRMSKFFKSLISARPKKLLKNDYKSLRLLHSVAEGGKTSVLKHFLQDTPKSLRSLAVTDDKGRLPIHIACKKGVKTPMLRVLLAEGMKQNIGGRAGMGGLMVKDDDGMTALDYFIQEFECRDSKWSSLNVLFEGIVEDVPLIHATIKLHDQRWKIRRFLSKHPKTAEIKDATGQLPLHIYIKEFGAVFGTDSVYRFILQSYPAAISVVDPETGLYPSMLAATQEMSDLRSVFHILREDPSAI